MAVSIPDIEQALAIAESYGLGLSRDELRRLLPFMEEMKRCYDALDRLPPPVLPVRSPQRSGFRPEAEENLYNAWYWRTEISGAPAGPLNGKRIALKDNICLASVPMMNGSRLLEGYVPDVDATVVTRILDAGGTIIGKAVCEDLCLSGASHTAKSGAVRNPRRPTHSSGGSSSGSAVVVASGDADIALGGDQGGSIRIPSSWSGTYGLKPTYGLVPYTGIFPIEMTLDHCGPIAGTVEDLALILSVIAGPDGLDPRQRDVRVADYMEAVSRPDVTGLRIGVVREGFGHPVSEPVVDRTVRQAAERFAALGTVVEDVSIPCHRTGYPIWAVILLQGSVDLIFRGQGMGSNWQGYYATSLLETFGRNFRDHADRLGETGKLNLLMAEFVRKYDCGRHYALAQNLRHRLRDAYDSALRNVDLLLMPTVPFRATPIPPEGAALEDVVGRARDGIDTNTAPTDATGHPAISFPCGIADGLPIGAMLIGRRWHEATILRATRTYELSGDWAHA
jgi:amidase